MNSFKCSIDSIGLRVQLVNWLQWFNMFQGFKLAKGSRISTFQWFKETTDSRLEDLNNIPWFVGRMERFLDSAGPKSPIYLNLKFMTQKCRGAAPISGLQPYTIEDTEAPCMSINMLKAELNFFKFSSWSQLKIWFWS